MNDTKAYHTTWEEKLEKRKVLKELKQRQTEMVETRKERKREIRRTMEERKKRREENERKNEKVQIITNASKLKRMSKKQFKALEKR